MLRSLTPVDGELIIPLAAVKARIKIDSDVEDADLARMRAEAIDYVERYTGKALQSRTFLWSVDRFSSPMRMPVQPVSDVTEVRYYDREGVDTVLAVEEWLFGEDVLAPAHGLYWPAASCRPGSVRVTLTAGYQDAETEAPTLITAVLVGIGILHKDREAPDWTPVERCARRYRRRSL